MKKLLLLALAACLPFSAVVAQGTFDVWFGNLDGTPMSVGINKVINLPIYITCIPDNVADSLGFVHMPLATDDAIIVARSGGSFAPQFDFPNWEDLSFLGPDLNQPVALWTSQSILGFCQTPPSGPPGDPDGDPPPFQGGPVLFGYYTMTTANDPLLIGTTVTPFQMGANPINGALYWGNHLGTVQWNAAPGGPINMHFGSLFFSPNQPPEWGANPGPVVEAETDVCEIGDGCNGMDVCFDVTGTDPDIENTLTIDGPDGFHVEGTGGSITGHFCAHFDASATPTFHFDLSDGQETL